MGTIGAWFIGNMGPSLLRSLLFKQSLRRKVSVRQKKSTLYAALLCLPLAVAIGVIGVAAHYLYPDIDPIYAFPVFLQHMNPILSAIVATSLVASIFVGVSTVALATTTLIIDDFYVPKMNPTPEQRMKITRHVAVLVGIVPLVGVALAPELLSLSFYKGASNIDRRCSSNGLYLPYFNSNRGATIGLAASGVTTTVWYLLDNPFGIDNMYIAIIIPFLVLVIDRLISPPAKKDQSLKGELS